MAAIIPVSFTYMPRIESLSKIEDLGCRGEEGVALLVGEYGPLAPLALFRELKGAGCGEIYIEIILRNKSRELVASSLITASAVGFSGACIATGLFDRREHMPKPVYDLDIAQTLRLVMELRADGSLRRDFLVGARGAAGCDAARDRARSFLDAGADFIALPHGELIPGLETRIRAVREVAAAS